MFNVSSYNLVRKYRIVYLDLGNYWNVKINSIIKNCLNQSKQSWFKSMVQSFKLILQLLSHYSMSVKILWNGKCEIVNVFIESYYE